MSIKDATGRHYLAWEVESRGGNGGEGGNQGESEGQIRLVLASDWGVCPERATFRVNFF